MPLTETISHLEARFERGRRIAGALLAPGAFGLTYHLTTDHLQAEGRTLAAVLAATAILWVTETLPLPLTALLSACLCVLLGVADAKTVFAPFADSIVFLFVGSFIVARAMTRHGLDRRLALGFLAIGWVAGRPVRIMLMLGAATAFVSMWASNTATTAMMAPIAMSILEALHNLRQTRDPHTPPDLRSWPFATALMLMVAYAASIGGIGTPVGSPPNLICIRQLRAALPDADLSFFRWMLVMVPLLTVMYGTLFGLLRWSAPQAPPTTAVAGEFRQYLRRQRDELGCWTASQVNTLAAFGVAVVLWIFPGLLALVLGADHPAVEWCGRRVPEAVVALLAALLLFVLPTDLRAGRFTIGWDDAVQIDWGTILLFGGGLSLGTLMFQTGVAKALGDALIQGIGIRSLWGLTALAVGLGILLSETSSNTASASMLIPVVIALAKSAEVHPVPPALGACLGASFGFMLPVSTPPNAIVYSSGLVPIGKMMRAGVMFDLCGYVIILGGLRVLCPLLGLA